MLEVHMYGARPGFLHVDSWELNSSPNVRSKCSDWTDWPISSAPRHKSCWVLPPRCLSIHRSPTCEGGWERSRLDGKLKRNGSQTLWGQRCWMPHTSPHSVRLTHADADAVTLEPRQQGCGVEQSLPWKIAASEQRWHLDNVGNWCLAIRIAS